MKMRLVFSALICISSFGAVALAHDWYTGLRNKYGWPCCDKHDFKPVQAWQDDAGQWHALYPNDDGSVTEWKIPDDLILDDRLNKEPFQAHLAIYKGEIRCFLRKATGG